MIVGIFNMSEKFYARKMSEKSRLGRESIEIRPALR
jgi:hypothetical protein